MKQPLFLRSADQLDRWLERYNPLQGATLGTLSNLFTEADEGMYAGVMWMARKLIRRDATIRACMMRINATVQRLDWEVKIMETLPVGVTPKMAEAQQAYLKERYSAIGNLTEAYSALARADFFGFAHLEKHYDTSGRVIRLQPVPQWHWCRKGYYGPWLYNAKAKLSLHDAVPIEPDNFIIHEVESPWIEIALISGLDRNQLRRDLRGFCARYGIPNTFFIAGPGATDDDMGELNDIASEMAADGTGALPPGADVKTHESQSKGEIFEVADKAFQSEIVMAATGGLLTMLTQSGSGTLAGGAHQDTWNELVGGIAMQVTEVMQQQLDLVWLNEKFPGQPVAAYFELGFPEQSEDREKLATTIKTLKDAGYAADPKWVSEETGIPLVSSLVVPPLGGSEKTLKNRTPSDAPPANDPAFMRLVKAMASDMAPVRDVLEQMLNADDAALDAMMAEMTTKLPELAAAVFDGNAADSVLRDLAAVELLRGASN